MRRRRRAGATMFFLLFMFPVLLFALALTSDVSRLIVTHREVADMADSLSIAAAHATNEEGNIDPVTAENEAKVTLKEALRVGMVPSSVAIDGMKVEILGDDVTVTVRYHLDDLMLLRFFTANGRAEGKAISRAAVCRADASESSCAYPV